MIDGKLILQIIVNVVLISLVPNLVNINHAKV